jgi:GNAT superfamily N-acetyltransferase
MTREVADRIAAGLVAAWKQRVGHLEGHVVRSDDGVAVCLSNLPSDDLNVALIEREPEDPLGALTRAEAVFEEHGCVFGLEVEHGRHPSVDRAVRALGLSVVLARPAMAMGISELPRPRPPSGVQMRPVTTPAELAAVVDIDVRVFGTARAVAERFAGPSLLSVDGYRAYVATSDGEAVGMALTSRHEDAVGVFGVGVVPEARRRGIGSALTTFAVLDAPGADLAWLQPTTMGLPLYTAMGFADAAAWEVWVRRGPAAGHDGT